MREFDRGHPLTRAPVDTGPAPVPQVLEFRPRRQVLPLVAHHLRQLCPEPPDRRLQGPAPVRRVRRATPRLEPRLSCPGCRQGAYRGPIRVSSPPSADAGPVAGTPRHSEPVSSPQTRRETPPGAARGPPPPAGAPLAASPCDSPSEAPTVPLDSQSQSEDDSSPAETQSESEPSADDADSAGESTPRSLSVSSEAAGTPQTSSQVVRGRPRSASVPRASCPSRIPRLVRSPSPTPSETRCTRAASKRLLLNPA